MAFYGIGNNQNGSFGYGGFGFSRGFYGNSFDRIQQDKERAAAETTSPNPDERTITPGHKPSCECSTCKSRKYKDGSDESDVSFQTAQHIDPGSAGSRVRAHEGEHVANAYEKAAEKGGKVLQASVAIKPISAPNVEGCMSPAGPRRQRSLTRTKRTPIRNSAKPLMQGFLQE